ncbi:MAG: hypothetical protein QM727_07225 [Niabella sp.]
MFNLFKKKNTQPNLKSTPELINFQKSFTEDQKAAMIYSLMLMVASEGSYGIKKFNYMTQQAELLNVDLEGKSMSVYQGKNADYAYSIIKTLSESQKDFYCVLLGNIMQLNGNPTQNEIKLADRILTEVGISEEKFTNAIIKTHTLMEKFK